MNIRRITLGTLDKKIRIPNKFSYSNLAEGVANEFGPNPTMVQRRFLQLMPNVRSQTHIYRDYQIIGKPDLQQQAFLEAQEAANLPNNISIEKRAKDIDLHLMGYIGDIFRTLDNDAIKIVPLSEAQNVAAKGKLGNKYARLSDFLDKTLTQRESKILKARLFCTTGQEQSYEEIAKELKITKLLVKIFEQKALRKLRQPSRVAELQKMFPDIVR